MRVWTRRLRWVSAHLLWNEGEPDPRVLQAGFTLAVISVLLLRSTGEQAVALESWPTVGVVVSTVGTAAVLAAPIRWVSVMTRVMAVGNIAVLGMLAVGTGAATASASPLLLLPALWLGQELGLRGVGLAVGSVLLFLTVPALIADGTDPVTLERSLILPVVAGVGAAAITAGLTAARAAQARAEAREADLVAALSVIEHSQRSANAIFEAVDIGLALLDSDGRPTVMNQRLAGFSELAYPGGDIQNPRVFDETGQRRLQVADIPTERARLGEEFDDVRVWIGEDERTRRAMSISARRVEDSEGHLLGAAVSYSDVTDFMRALQVKDEFMALVSHELRTPLTSIIGYVAIALDDDEDAMSPVLRKQLEVVARNGRRLERLVDDLLDEMQQSRRPASVREQRTDLAEIVRDSVAGAGPLAASAGVRLVATVPDPIPFTGDAQRLGQAVDNLVSNAIKYTSSGGRAEVRLTIEDGAAVIQVSDTGIGICAEDQIHLFTRFFRTREATLSAIQGVGLGLSITKSIVETHGGRIEVDSEVGRGSEFRVVLPLPAVRLAS